MDPEIEEKYKKSGKITAQARDYGASLIKEGASVLEVVSKIEDFILKKGGRIAFPVNIAIDDVAAHFTPTHNDKLVFEQGNLVKLDVGVHVDGYIGDSAITIEVGTRNWQDLIKASSDALDVAIEMMKPGVNLMLVGRAIEQTITSYGFKPINNLTGHSLEQYKLHAGISIPNVEEFTKGTVKEGDVLAIEPFSTNGGGRVKGFKKSNIYRFLKEQELKSAEAQRLQRVIKVNRKGLPFSERWCYRYTKKSTKVLQKLVSERAITMYPILKDVKNGMVAQTEHTVIITNDGAKIIT
ncbi:MAG: type II methionyl aminopeptidase [Thermoplasmata archaeon]|nr:MAG: type II methionyl aminopeptidase [Thermoplasmata archaeon]